MALALVGSIVTSLSARAQTIKGADEMTVSIAQTVDAESLNPFVFRTLPTYNVLVQMYDTLGTLEPSGKLVPSLATSIRRVSPTVWEFKLRRSVHFWNGDLLTSADVKFTIAKFMDPSSTAPLRSRVDTIVRVETPDRFTVRYITRKPTPLVPGRPYGIFIVDARYWRRHGDAFMAEHAMGTGPYVLRRWAKDDELELEANTAYWRGRPAVRHVFFRSMPDAAERVARLETQAADLITNVPPQYVLQLSKAQDTRVAVVPSTQILAVAFNLAKPGPQQSRLVRQALNYALDVPAIIDAVLGGHAQRLATPVPPGFIGHDATVAAYEHDPLRARTLLTEAGFPNGRGLDMILHSPNGRFAQDAEVAQAIAGQLREAGINVTVQLHDQATYLSEADGHLLSPMYMIGWTNNTYDADDVLTTLLASNSRLSTYANPAFDRLISAARFEMNSTRRLRLYSQALHLIHDDAPWLFLFRYDAIYATAKRLVWQPRPDGFIFCREMKLIPSV